jgi:hypothetical protein
MRLGPTRTILAAFTLILPISLANLANHKTFHSDKELSRGLFSSLNKERTGIGFRHCNGALGEKEMIEIMGAGCAVFDYDNDGRLDIYLVNGAAIPSLRKEDDRYFNRLYHNSSNFKFTDVTLGAGVQGKGYGMGAAAADYDNDGFIDLYLTNYGRNQLLRNHGDGSFVDVTDKAGVGAGGWSTSAAFFDYNRDEQLDLYVCRYVEYELEKRSYCGRPELGWRSYCLPDLFPELGDLLYRNNGDGTFTDVSSQTGISRIRGKGLGVAVADFDRDGWTDIFVANDRTRNFLFHNQRNGCFEEIGLPMGVALSANGQARAGMGTDFGDFDRDGWPDIVVTNFEAEGIALFQNHQSHFFHDRGGETRLMEASYPYVGFGIKFMDFDNDGWLDIFAVNGHVLDDVSRYKEGISYAQPKLLFHNSAKSFSPVREPQLGALSKMNVSRGAAFGDLDNDGDIDVVVNNNGGLPEILRNDVGSRQSSFLLKLMGAKSNRDGIGTRLEIRSDDGVRVHEVNGAGSYLSYNDPRVHVGLGRRTHLDQLSLHWPSGKRQTIRSLGMGYLHVISEEKGLVSSRKLK